jgi:arginyl-tRNA synthetase
MNLLSELRERFAKTLNNYPDATALADLIRPAQDARFGDYQANCAMALGKQLDRPPREVAQELVQQTHLDDLCESVEIAGPGFINLKLKSSWISDALLQAAHDKRLAVTKTAKPQTIIVDFSSPNVAKPMHVGHIRSTVIGDALARVLRFLGHHVITDNHLGDWGTQFGMIIYGFKHFVDREQYDSQPIAELSRLYRLVRKLIDFHEGTAALPARKLDLAKLEQDVQEATAVLASAAQADRKKADKNLKRLQKKVQDEQAAIAKLQETLAAVQQDPTLGKLATEHANIGQAVQQETAKLHQGDAENLALWHEFLPACRDEINRVYQRLSIRFDHELGESFYHPQLADTVQSLIDAKLATESNGALCVFLKQFDAPMIVRKSDGAFLYATTDLATIQYRMEQWNPALILYVVDHRQSEHFQKLFAVAAEWEFKSLQLFHVSFGTVMGADGKPFKTRDGDTIGLEGLLDQAVAAASRVVEENAKNIEFTADEMQRVAEVVGIGALKYADLSQNRSSDYEFSYEKMLALNGNTAPYLQFSYARVQGIFRKSMLDINALRGSVKQISLDTEQERKLALELLRFEEALLDVVVDYRPNQLTSYLYGLAKCFMSFAEACRVLDAESESLRDSRLLLCDLTARTIATGLELLGIHVVEKM